MTNILQKMRDTFTSSTTEKPGTLTNTNLTPEQKYIKVKAMYDNNGLYDEVKRFSDNQNVWLEALKPLRTVVHRSVEFYVAKLIPDIQIVTDKEVIRDTVTKFYKWSNFKAKKQTICRDLALYGDLFLKVVGNENKVYFENIQPKHVTDFEEDTRGNLVKIRIDVPFTNDEGKKVIHTEYWSEPDGYYSIWEHNNPNADLDRLGSPKEFGFLAEMGIDFIPIRHYR